MMKFAALASFLTLSSLGWADASYFGIYLNGGKVGYSILRNAPELVGEAARASVSETVLRSALLGTDLDMKITSTTLTDAEARPIQITYVTESGGRKQTVEARFNEKTIEATISNGGTVSSKSIPIPLGTRVVDDATSVLILQGPGSEKSFKVSVLDPTTVTLIQNEVIVLGPTKVEVRGSFLDATLVTIRDPRATTKIYYGKGEEVLKIEGPLGMIMLPESKEVALAEGGPRTDLGFSAAIPVTPAIERPLSTTRVEFRVTGVELDRLPTDKYQTSRKEGSSWKVTIHPTNSPNAGKRTIQQASKNAKKWIAPSLHIPSNDAKMRALARSIIGEETRFVQASDKINRWVFQNMRENAGIGVLRNATEVLESKEGVCRDYAILGATLMRVAGIPTRLASGLIYDSGQMFYHAWLEVFDGTDWRMLDPTRATQSLNATRLKLAHGQVEDAFTFAVLHGAKFEVVSVRHR